MKRRHLHKKWNRELKELSLQLKRDKEKSHFKTYLSYEYYEDQFTWSDIYFIGTFEGRKRVFNCCIQSAIDEFNCEIDSVVNTKLDKIYPNRYENTEMVFEDASDSNCKYKTLEFIVHDEELDKKIKESEKELLKESIMNKEAFVRSYVKALPDYQYGVGLDIVTEEKMINEQIILKYVKLVQSMNITNYDKIFLSDTLVEFDEKDHYNSADFNYFCKALITD